MPIFRKMWLFVWRFIYISKVLNSKDMLICICVIFICWKVVISIQNIVFFNETLGKSVIFLVKSTLHLVEQFSEEGVNLVVNFGKNDNWF